MSQFSEEIRKRRTFAIISHPDAGKTTLTEKLLLFGGAIHVAGAVKSNKIKKTATSDWMEIEKQRGISVATSVMGFNYDDYKINILDTPGHQDFAEDTFRTLTAVDSVIIVVDIAKGVEAQTRKLMEVCRMRKTPVIVFVNKLDRDGKDPFDLLDEIEEELQINVRPLSWPIDMGQRFKGVYNIFEEKLNLYTPSKQFVTENIEFKDINSPELENHIGAPLAVKLRSDIELIEGVYPEFDVNTYLAGDVAPVFFGSAVNNFGVQSLLDAVVELSPAPLPRPAKSRTVEPIEPKFSGFVFKIQANMDPKHRDRIAFIRVCAGRFERGGKLKQVSTGKSLAINNAITFMAQDRNTTDEAWAGDIIGIPNHGTIHLGDTFTEGEDLQFTGIPSFAPEHFRRAQIKNPLKMKQLQKGLEQLAQEGATQLFRPTTTNELILGAVGTLQFDVVAHRLEFEYGVDVMFESCSYVTARWLRGSDADLKALADKSPANIALDGNGDYVYLAPNRVNLQMAQERFPDIKFLETREIY
mgnify:CR=1 FL=1